MPEIQKFQAFFSYARLDSDVDPDLVTALTTQLALRVTRKLINADLTIWRDVTNLRTGQRWDDRIREAVRQSRVFIVLMTPKWFESANCRREYEIFKEVENAIGVGEYVVPILARDVDKQLAYFDAEQTATYRELMARQYRTAIATTFLALTANEREILIDAIAGDVENMIDSLRRKVVRAPEVPPQGRGPHYEVGDDDRVTFAPPAALDRHGNNVALLKKLQPTLRDLAAALVSALGIGNTPHHRLGSRVEAYRKLIDQDLDGVDFTLLYVEGVRLENADKAAIGDETLPPLGPTERADMDSLLQLHGRFMMATAEGIEEIEASQRYRRNAREEAQYRTAAHEFVQSIEAHPQVVDPEVAKFARAAVDEIGTGSKPERSSSAAAGVVTNLAVTLMGAATFGALGAAAAASQSPPLIAGAAAALLVFGEGLKKSKPFAVVAGLFTKGFDKVSEKEVAQAYREIGERLALHLTLARDTGPRLRRLADQRDSGLDWVIGSLSWLAHPTAPEPIDPATVPEVEDPPPAPYLHAPGFAPGDRFRDFPNAPEMIIVPSGAFMMGSPPGEGDDDERPQHEVVIQVPFAVGIAPVTRGQFRAFMQAKNRTMEDGAHVWTGEQWEFDPTKSWLNPGFPQTDDHPVVCVHWFDAKAYIEWLDERSGSNHYRLLTEAEWEFCCRAGTTTPYSTGTGITSRQANFGTNENGTTAVSRFDPNPWGLRDMHGNVWEWCEDPWHDNYAGDPPSDGSVWEGSDKSRRVLRGGAWYVDPRSLRSANRDHDRSDSRGVTAGFRVARRLSPPAP